MMDFFIAVFPMLSFLAGGLCFMIIDLINKRTYHFRSITADLVKSVMSPPNIKKRNAEMLINQIQESRDRAKLIGLDQDSEDYRG